MAATALKRKPAPAPRTVHATRTVHTTKTLHATKTFHATMLVTRAEEWCVEAESAEEARALLAAGLGHRCHLGERVQFEVERVED